MKLVWALCLCCWLAASPVRAATVVPGELTVADLVAVDSVGTFHYDAYALTVEQPGQVDLSLHAAGFNSWLGLWAAPVLPAGVWEDGGSIDLYQSMLMVAWAPPGQAASFGFAAQPGILYHLAVATQLYMDTPMGPYTLSTAAQAPGAGLVVSSVPEPAAMLLALMGLGTIVGAARLRRRGQAQASAGGSGMQAPVRSA